MRERKRGLQRALERVVEELAYGPETRLQICCVDCIDRIRASETEISQTRDDDAHLAVSEQYSETHYTPASANCGHKLVSLAGPI